MRHPVPSINSSMPISKPDLHPADASPAASSPAWPTVKRLFQQALELPGSAREALLAAAEVDDAVRAEVRSLLAHSPDPTGQGNAGFLAAPAAIDVLGQTDRSGEQLGPWQIVRALGAGGMGDVFEARRADGSFEGRAAVKLLKRGMDSVAVLQRFAHERQALARLNHPHIATLLDAGLSNDGLPYFVMEFVDGTPIDQAVRGLSLPQRLGLFLQLTDAVAYAHRNLLVHGDLKPGNVLVTTQGQVKLLDFGIARALDPLDGGTAAAGNSSIGMTRPFTPNYASPEQVRGEPVGTATDIYSLGVLLYQLLTGVRPTGRDATTPAQAARSVLDETPTCPSTLPADLTNDPDWLATRKHLAGDLDNILLKALEKPVERRYASVDALAADVQAFLDGRPVTARTANWHYVAGRFVRRHTVPVALAALLFVSLVAGVGVSAWQAREARLARDASQRHLADVRRLANVMIFEVNDGLRNGATQARKVLVKTAADYLGRQAAYTDQTDAERIDLAQALNGLAKLEGHAYTDNVGELDVGRDHYRQALALLEPLSPSQEGNADWQSAMVSALEGLSSIERERHHLEDAMALMRRVAHHARRVAALRPTDIKSRAFECAAQIELSSHHYMVERDHGLNQLDQAMTEAERALDCTARLVGFAPGHFRAWKLRSYALHTHAGLQGILGRLEASAEEERLAWEAAEKVFALPGGAVQRTMMVTSAQVHLQLIYTRSGAEEDAERHGWTAMERAEADLRDDPTNQRFRAEYLVAARNLLYQLLRVGAQARMPALYERIDRVLATTARDRPVEDVQVERAGLDAVQVMGWAQLGRRDRADAGMARLLALLEAGRLVSELEHTPGDSELLAAVRTAQAAVAVLDGHPDLARSAARQAMAALDAMRSSRDPRDVVEQLIASEYLVLLAKLNYGADGPARSMHAELVSRARSLLVPLAERRVLPERARPEGRWLAAQPPA